MTRAPQGAVDVSETPFALGSVVLGRSQNQVLGGLSITLESAELASAGAAGEETRVDLLAWKNTQEDDTLTQPVLRFEIAGISYVLVADDASFIYPQGETKRWEAVAFQAALFSDQRPEPLSE